MASLEKDGFIIFRDFFAIAEIKKFRQEADRISAEAGSACVRHLRKSSSVFDELSVRESLIDMMGADAFPVRSILFDKTPKENWPVAWHQDLTIAVEKRVELECYGSWSVKEGAVHVQPPVAVLEGMVTARIHLDETPSENGALRIIPGSHRLGRISVDTIAGHTAGNEVVCECGAGDLLLMSPLILHSSKRSERPGRRRVIHFEYARPRILHPTLRWHEINSSI